MTYNESQMPAWQRALSDRVAVDIVFAWMLAAVAYLLVAIDAPSALRFAIAGPALFVLPGYVLVAMLYPHRGPEPTAEPTWWQRGPGRVTVRQRFALSFGLSLAIIPVLGIAISVSPWGFSELVIARAFVAFVVLGGVVAAAVRRRLPTEDRYRLSLDRWVAELRHALFDGSIVDRALNWLVITSVVAALLVAGGALAVPQGGQTFTDFAVLGENEDGDLVAGSYPDELAPNESATLVTAVENNEGESVEYTVVVTVERTGPIASNASNATDPAGNVTGEVATDSGDRNLSGVERHRYSATVAPGDRWTHRHDLDPDRTESRLRVHYYLFRGDAPADPDTAPAYRHLHLWIDAVGDDP